MQVADYGWDKLVQNMVEGGREEGRGGRERVSESERERESVSIMQYLCITCTFSLLNAFLPG